MRRLCLCGVVVLSAVALRPSSQDVNNTGSILSIVEQAERLADDHHPPSESTRVVEHNVTEIARRKLEKSRAGAKPATDEERRRAESATEGEKLRQPKLQEAQHYIEFETLRVSSKKSGGVWPTTTQAAYAEDNSIGGRLFQNEKTASLYADQLRREAGHNEEALEHLEGGHLFQLFCVIILPPLIALPLYMACFRYHKAPHETFSFGLFDCWGDAFISGAACCCPAIRWADTMSYEKANLVPFYLGFSIFVLLGVVRWLGLYGVTLGTLATAIVGTIFRQRLRAHYGLAHGDLKTYLSDFFVWLCFPPCAIMQEARHVEWIEDKLDSEVYDEMASATTPVAKPPTQVQTPQSHVMGTAVAVSGGQAPKIVSQKDKKTSRSNAGAEQSGAAASAADQVNQG